jgi:hypothetical protein
MKVVIYTLNENGEIPEYVLDGGYFPNPNGGAFPQDVDMVGIANDDAPGTELSSKADVLSYCATFMDETVEDMDGRILNTADIVSSWCDEKGIG